MPLKVPARALGVLALAAAGACLVEPLDLTGKACAPPDHPCLEGFMCIRGTCQRPPEVRLGSEAATVLAGTCAAGQLSLHLPSGEPALPDTDTPVALDAGGGMRLFADPSCAQEAPVVTVPAGASDASFSFLALRGGQYQLEASISGSRAVLDQGISPMVRTGRCALGEGESQVACPVTPPVLDQRRSFALFQATSGAVSPGDAGVRCRLTAPSAVSCDRDGDGGAAAILWQVAEVPGARVQAPSASTSCSFGTAAFPLASAVDPAAAFVLFSEHHYGLGYGMDDFNTAVLTDPTTVVVTSAAGCAALGQYAIQVVERPGARVRRGFGERMDAGVSAIAAAGAPADAGSSLLLHTHRYAGQPSSPACAKLIRGEVPAGGGTQLRFSRSVPPGGGGACTAAGSEVTAIAWEHVQLPPGDRVQQLVVDLAPGNTQRRIAIAPVDPTRTVVLASGQGSGGQAMGETREALRTDVAAAVAALELDAAGDSVLATRASDGGLARFTIYVWELGASP